MVPPTYFVHLALAFYVKSFQTFYVGGVAFMSRKRQLGDVIRVSSVLVSWLAERYRSLQIRRKDDVTEEAGVMHRFNMSSWLPPSED